MIAHMVSDIAIPAVGAGFQAGGVVSVEEGFMGGVVVAGGAVGGVLLTN